MTISSCAFFFLSPVMALEGRKRNGVGRWSRRERHGCVRQLHLCRLLRLLCHESGADSRTFRVTLVREDPSCPDRVRPYKGCTRSFLSCTGSQPALPLHTVWKNATHPSHRRSTRGRNWPFLQDRVPPLLVQIQVPADNQSETMLASIHVSLPAHNSLQLMNIERGSHGSTWSKCCVFLHNS